MSFTLHPNRVRLPPLYAMFTDDDTPTSTTRSHAKKKPADYVPRPKNAFIIFRTLFSKWNATLPRVADPNRPGDPVAISDHRSLSKHAGETWRCMTEEEKRPYKELADEDKAQHRIKHPDYKYSPGERAPSRKTVLSKRGRTEQRSESPPSSVPSEVGEQLSIVDDIVSLYPPRRRSSSCPPASSQSWNIALPQPFVFPPPTEESAPVFTNPFSNSLCDDPYVLDQRTLPDAQNTWRRGSRDDFAIQYGQSRAISPNPPLCNTMGEFTRRTSKYDAVSFGSYTLGSALIPSIEMDAWSPLQFRDVPPDFTTTNNNFRWDRKISRDDLDMHFWGATNPALMRTRREQDIRKTSIDDIGINYGSASRLHEWNQGFDTHADLNPLKINEYLSHHHQVPPHSQDHSLFAALSPVSVSSGTSTAEVQDFSTLTSAGFGSMSPYQGMPSGFMAMHLDPNNPPPNMELDPSLVAPLDQNSAVPSPSHYNYPSSAQPEEYSYADYVHDDLSYQSSRETTAGPEFTAHTAHAHEQVDSMEMYQQSLQSVGIQS